jgi:hypothetical protein
LKQIGKTELSEKYRIEYDRYVVQATFTGEKQHIKKTYPEPDLGDDAGLPSETDRQGQGQLW